MKPTPAQIRQAMRNHRRPSRTTGARIRDAITHAKVSRTQGPAQNVFSQTIDVTSVVEHRNKNHASYAKYNPDE